MTDIKVLSRDVENDIRLLKRRWPQSHAVRGMYNDSVAYLITVPSVFLFEPFEQRICTVLFVAPASFRIEPPINFYTDIEITRSDGVRLPGTWSWKAPYKYWMYGIEWSGGGSAFSPWDNFWPQWSNVMAWGLRLQHWNPVRDNLYTYMGTIIYGLRYYFGRKP